MMGVSNNSTTGLKPRRTMKMDNINSKPRSLKLSTSSDTNLESVLVEMEGVTQYLQSGGWDHRLLCSAVTSLCDNLKVFGGQLESLYKDQLDKCFIYLRTGCRDDRMSLASRYRLLEIIELRAMNWRANQNLISYYHSKLQSIELEEAAMEEQNELAAYMSTPQHTATVVSPTAVYPMQYGGGGAFPPTTPTHTTLLPPQTLVYAGQQYHQSVMTVPDQYHHLQTPTALINAAASPQVVTTAPAPMLLSPGEVVRNSGKFTKPTRIAGKNYCKDEVVIRNQDSGKVMGIKGRRVHMIEELSETIISFQRVNPGARERLVQITGPTEENISQAKHLIEDTIRRNASPAREAPHSLSSGGGSSVFSSSPLNGSNSSIASHTDDEGGSLNGCKRSSVSLSHSLSMTDASDVADYRYTVSHNNTNIRITGTSPGMVRTAKLVLDEYFNGHKNLSSISHLIGSESLPPTITSPLPPNNPPPLAPHRVSSSPSSPPLLVKPATPPATPPPVSSNESDAPPPRGDESPKNGGVGIVRQPLFPSSSKEAIDSAENNSTSDSVGARNRRAAFAKTQEERRVYSRSDLLSLSDAPDSRLTPARWSEIIKSVPELVKKGYMHLPGLLATLSEKGAEGVSARPSYLQTDDFVTRDSQMNWSPKWTDRRRSSSGNDE